MEPLKNVRIPKEKRDQLSDFAKRRMIYMRNYRVKKILEELRGGL